MEIREINFNDVRKLFPSAESCVYMDSAHYSPYSLITKERLEEFIFKFSFTNLNLSIFNIELANTIKQKSATLINANKEDIIITSSTSHGLNIFANGLKLLKGDSVAYADSEFPAIVYPWMNQEILRGVKNIKIPSSNGKIRLEDIEKTFLNHSVKVLTISSVGFLGFRNDLEEIGKLCKKFGVLFAVDAIQSTGIVPIDVQKFGIDFLATGGQKWMMSPAGIGFAYISPRIREMVVPTYVSTSNVNYNFEKFLDYKLDLKQGGSAYENSTLNTLGMIGLESTLDLFLYIGIEKIFNYIKGLLDYFAENLKRNKNYYIESELSPKHKSNIIIFSHINFSENQRIQKYLESRDIFIAAREGFLRISPHIFNNTEDIDKLLIALKEY